MNIYLDSIHLPELTLNATSNMLGKLRNHFVKNIQTLSACIRYNELTLVTTTLGFSFACIKLSEKVMELAISRFQINLPEEPLIFEGISALSKAMIISTGLCLLNQMMKLELNRTSIAINVISSIALQLIYKSDYISFVHQYFHRCGDVEGKESATGRGDQILEETSGCSFKDDSIRRNKGKNNQLNNEEGQYSKEKIPLSSSQIDASPFKQSEESLKGLDSNELIFSDLSDTDNSEGSKLINSVILDDRLSELENLDS